MGSSFFLAMEPPTKTFQAKMLGRKRNGKPVIFDSPDVKLIRDRFAGLLYEHRPKEPMSGAIKLTVKWLYPIVGSHINGEYKTSRPDIDNIMKLLMDAMTTVGFWKDDAQVVALQVEKFWADIPGIYIHVRGA